MEKKIKSQQKKSEEENIKSQQCKKAKYELVEVTFYFTILYLSIVASSINMDTLKSELQKTEDELSRQQLKIALHSTGAPKFHQSVRGLK